MKSTQLDSSEKDHLISWSRTEDIIVGSLSKLYFNISYAGCYVCRKTFEVRRQKFVSTQLLLTLEGEGKLHYRENDYCLTPGTVMLIDTWNPHEYRALDDGWKFKYIHFRGGMSNEYLAYIDRQFGPVFSLNKKLFQETEERIDVIFRETECTDIPDYPTVSSTIYAILTSFLSPKNAIGSAQRSAMTIQRAVAYIADKYSENITTKEIADAAFLSRSYMSELFKKTYGMSPHEYLTMYRLSHVKEYLRNTTLSLSEIAELTGFRDVFTLSRVFKQKFNVPPSEYRKSILP